MLDQHEQCLPLLVVQHIVLGFFTLLTTCFTGWLVHRRYQADKREKENGDSKPVHRKHK